METDVTKLKIDLKTVVIVVLWVASILGTYYTMKSRLDAVTAKSDKLEQRIEKYNPEIIEYKISNIESQLNKVNEKADKIQELLSQ